MKNRPNQPHAFAFWSCASWAIVIIQALITIYFYYKWIPHNVATGIEIDYAIKKGIPVTYDITGFYLLFYLSLILITSRALDFTNRSLHIFCVIITAIIILLSYIAYRIFCVEVQDSFVIFIIAFILTAFFAIFFAIIGVINSFFIELANYGHKIFLLQGLLSIVAKIIIWLPFFLEYKYSFEFLANISFLYAAATVVFSILTFNYRKKQPDRHVKPANNHHRRFLTSQSFSGNSRKSQ